MTDVMFPKRGDTATLLRALRVCDSCAVRDECRAYADEIDERDGIWAGTTGRQRRIEKRRALRQASN